MRSLDNLKKSDWYKPFCFTDEGAEMIRRNLDEILWKGYWDYLEKRGDLPAPVILDLERYCSRRTREDADF